MRFRKLSKSKDFLHRRRSTIVYVILATLFSGVLQNEQNFSLVIIGYTAAFWFYAYVELRRKYNRPRSESTRAILKVSTEPNIDWAVTTIGGELVVSGWGSRVVELPSNKTFVNRKLKVKYAEYLYCAEVTSGNGDAFVSLTVDDEDEFSQTVVCGSSGNQELLFTSLNTGYGTRHWLIPGFMQGIPSIR
jgi:hypothetical protein